MMNTMSVLKEFRRSETYSIMVDELTDTTTLKQLVCYGMCICGARKVENMILDDH